MFCCLWRPMIMHASFKHFLRYVRKMCILLNPWVNTREYMCTSTTKTGHTVSHKGCGGKGHFRLFGKTSAQLLNSSQMSENAPVFCGFKYIHKKYIHRAPSTALCIVLSHSKALMSPVLLEVKTMSLWTCFYHSNTHLRWKYTIKSAFSWRKHIYHNCTI